MMIVANKYEHGDIVYLKTDPYQMPRQVLSFTLFKSGEIMYAVTSSSETSNHHEFELSKEENTDMDKYRITE